MSSSPERAGLRRSAGVTLVELIVSLLVVAIAVVGTLRAIAITSGHSADPMIVHQASAIAEAHLEEILLKPFYDPDLGPGGGVCPAREPTRDLYDNVCDYRGLDDSGPRDQDGNPVPGLAAYRVRVDVDTSADLGGISGPTRAVRVDVRVNHVPPFDITLSGYRASY